MKSTTSASPPSNPGGDDVGVGSVAPSRDWLWAHLLVLCAVGFAATFVGPVSWTPRSVWDSCVSGDGAVFSAWIEIRARRVLFAGTVGALLSVAGSVFQSILRNPLAEPYILGVSGGASLATVLALVLGVDLIRDSVIFPIQAWIAFGGSLLSVMLLFAIARWGRLRDPANLILCGVVLNSIFLAGIVLFLVTASETLVTRTLPWLMGDLSGVHDVVPRMALLRNGIAVLGGVLLFWGVSRRLDLMSLSDEEAADLGVPVARFRWVTLIGASLLTGIAVAGVGPVGFVGLIVPHIIKLIHGPVHRRVIPATAVTGATFLIASDAIARAIGALPVGAITALAGGPFFFLLLVRQRREVGS
ncbi:MAG: iron ABC transporter permease [Planctomycetes bacterium]|nr:iron ABC transporter permease [Planctomycetota bacterium]